MKYVFFCLVLPLFIIAILFFIDAEFLNSKYFNKIMYKSDCSYVVPAGYKIVYNKYRNKYAVADPRGDGSYLWNGTEGIQPMYISITEPSLFDDTCSAKGYLEAYKNQQNKNVFK